MLELSILYGVLPHDLMRRLPERDLQMLQHYAARRMLPWRRMELYLAQVALIVAQCAGNKNVKLSDFLFVIEDDESETPEDELAAAIEAFGFSPRNPEDE